MQTIYKYQFSVADTVTLLLPDGASIVKIGLQDNEPGFGRLVLWAIVNTEHPKVPYTIYCRGTGRPMPEQAGKYMDSVMDGPFVWHVFDSATTPQ